jgi:hypothetical protein
MTTFIHFSAHNHLYKTYKVENDNKHNLLTTFGFCGQNRIHPGGYFSDPCTSTIFNLLYSPFVFYGHINTQAYRYQEIHNYNTTYNNNLHPRLANLTKFNKGPYISGIKIFNQLPQYSKALVHNSKHFRYSLKRFLYHHSFYSLEEYYEYKENIL